MNYQLKGKIALVTGAGQGIGRAAAVSLARSGADVILCGRTLDKLEKAAKEVEAAGAKALPIQMDICSIDDINHAVAKGVEVFGHIDVLINSAGIWMPCKITEMVPEIWDTIVNTNLRGAAFMAKAVSAHMVEKGIHGTILFVSSQAAKMGEYGNSAYGAAKAALHTMTQCMALELAEYDINVVAICPGSVNTEMLQGVMIKRGAEQGMTQEEYKEVICSKIPMNRLAEPSEIGNLLCFLASDDASYITGVNLTVAGGQTII